MKYTFLLLVICISFVANAQDNNAVAENPEDKIYLEMEVDTPAEYGDGTTEMHRIIATNIQFPPQSVENGISGMVITSLIIEKNGTTSQKLALRGPDEFTKAEAIRVLNVIPDKWKPATKDGQPVRYRLILPISFQIDDTMQSLPEALNKTGALNMSGNQNRVNDTIYHKDNGDIIYSKYQVDKPANYPGGKEKMFNFLMINMKRPRDVMNRFIEDSVLGCFIIEKDGSLTAPITVQGTSNYCQDEVIRLISLMPKWEPAIRDGEPVRMEYVFSITFGANNTDRNTPVNRNVKKVEITYDATETQDYEKALELSASGDNKQAILLLDWLIRSDPRNTKLLITKGEVNYKLERYKAACSDFKAAYKYGAEEAKELVDKYCK